MKERQREATTASERAADGFYVDIAGAASSDSKREIREDSARSANPVKRCAESDRAHRVRCVSSSVPFPQISDPPSQSLVLYEKGKPITYNSNHFRITFMAH